MIVADEDALICDLAETYGIYDYKSLPVTTVATLALGLKGNSRIMKKMTGQPVDDDLILLAGILDRLSFIAWTKTKDAQHGRNRPEFVLNNLLNGKKKTVREYETFSSGEEFLERLEQLRKG